MKKLDLNIILRRVGAYMIDILVVLVLASLISSIPFLNKDIDKYQSLYDEYKKIYNEYTETVKLLNDSYKEDKELNEEEYNNLLTKETYKDLFVKTYEDGKLEQKEYNSLLSDMEKKYTDLANDYNYKLQKLGLYNSIITLLCTLLYFGIVQYFLKGQTIGKKILKLQVVSANNKKINIINYLLRTLIVNDVFLNGINLILLFTLSRTLYDKGTNIISLLISIIEAVIIFLVITRPDHRGLHDLLFNTQVISTKNEVEKPKKEPKIIDAK